MRQEILLVPVHLGFERSSWGMAYGRHSTCIWGKIEFSVDLFSMDREMIENTILHEAAHMIGYAELGGTNHLRPWRQCMLRLGVPNARAS